VEGKVLHYLEGWHIISEANRIFGFDGWDRETIQSQCVWQKQIDYRYAAAYLTRVKISVRAGDRIIQREGLGSGEAVAQTAGQAHERASTAAETDATKRALSTFGNSFGLSLYRDKSEAPQAKSAKKNPSKKSPPGSEDIEANEATENAIEKSEENSKNAPPKIQSNGPAGTEQMIEVSLPAWLPAGSHANDTQTETATVNPPQRIEKSALALPEPKRIRNREHLRFVASQPCLICARTPSQAHHLRFAQPRALGRKVSDEFTVPLCAIHHHELHMRGNERAWWEQKNVEPLAVAGGLWRSGQRSQESVGISDRETLNKNNWAVPPEPRT
jgi:hypothetical protein